MPYIPLSFFQARFWTVWGDLCSIWLDSGHAPLSRPMLVSLGSCHMRNWLHWVLTYAMPLGATFHFNNTSYPQLQRMNHCHTYECTCTSFHTLTVQCYVLHAYPFNLKGTRRKCAKFLHSDITVVPSSECCNWNSLSTPSCPRFALECVLQNV